MTQTSFLPLGDAKNKFSKLHLFSYPFYTKQIPALKSLETSTQTNYKRYYFPFREKQHSEVKMNLNLKREVVPYFLK